MHIIRHDVTNSVGNFQVALSVFFKTMPRAKSSILIQINSFSHERFCTRPYFENEDLWYSEGFPWPAGPCSLALLGPGLSLHEIVSKQSLEKSRLRKQRTLCNATNGFRAKMKSEKQAQKITY